MTLHDEQQTVQNSMNHALSGLQGDPWLAQRVLAAQEEPERETSAKNVMIRGMIITVLVIILTMTVAVAAISAFGVFDLFLSRGDRLQTIMPYTEKYQDVSICIETEELGISKVELTDMYYDGYTLDTGIRITNGFTVKEYEPDNFSLSCKTKRDSANLYSFSAQDDETYTAWRNKMEKGEPCGIRHSELSVYPTVDTPNQNTSRYSYGHEYVDKNDEQDVRYVGTEVCLTGEEGMPDAAPISVDLYVVTEDIWFDGIDIWHTMPVARKLEQSLNAVVHRAELETRQYQGTGMVNGMEISATVNASMYRMQLRLELLSAELQPLEDEKYYDYALVDEEGNIYWGYSIEDDDEWKDWHCAYNLDGKMPESLDVYFMVVNTTRYRYWNQLPDDAEIIHLEIQE